MPCTAMKHDGHTERPFSLTSTDGRCDADADNTRDDRTGTDEIVTSSAAMGTDDELTAAAAVTTGELMRRVGAGGGVDVDRFAW